MGGADGNANSLITCIICHNVHGSNQHSMIRDGRLINKEPGMVVYYNDGVEPLGASNTTLAESVATTFIPATAGNICANCHGRNAYYKYDRASPGERQVPTLSWSGEVGYTADGVHPDSATGGSSMVFRVGYADLNNESPKYIQLWLDENDNGTYEDEEKYEMTKAEPTDLNYTDGALYRKTLFLARAGDGTLNYRFYATDGKDDATGAPNADSTITLTSNAPMLAWTGELAFSSDGVSPNSGVSESGFEFRIQYTDLDNEAPSSIQLWLDQNDSGAYEPGEKYAMTEVDASDVDYTDGKLYTMTRAIGNAGDGILNYRFFASDGTDDAVGIPTADLFIVLAAANNIPILAWTGEAGYGDDGADSDNSASCANPEFRVKYTDSKNVAPSSIQVWVDENDNGTYEVSEKYNMDAADAGDSEYWNGKLYTKSLDIGYAADGALNYRFYASDGIADASGVPTSDQPISVVGAHEVPSEYDTIQAAISVAVNGDYVCVSDGTYREQISFSGKAITVKAVNGATSTILEGNGANAAVVVFNSGEDAGSVLDGFTIDNQAAANSATRGIYIDKASPTIKNSIIQSNSVTSKSGGGIYIYGGGATIENSVIGNEGHPNTAHSGAGIYFADSVAGTLTIRDSAITYNAASWNGGGIYLSNVTNPTVIENTSISNNDGGVRFGGGIRAGNAPLSIIDSHIDNNISAWSGAGLFLTSATASFENSTVVGNSCSWGSGGGIYFTGDSSTLSINGSTVADNVGSPFGGGGLHIEGIAQDIVVDNSIFSNNTGRNGGAIRFSGSDSTLLISDSRLLNNTGAFGAGGLALFGGVLANEITVERTVIAGNHGEGVGGWGGGVYIASVAENPETPETEATFISSTFTNCTVAGNSAYVTGGGFYIGGIDTTVDIKNCTLSGNVASRAGGIHADGATLTVNNSIIWGSRPPEIIDVDGSATFTNTNIRQGGYEGNGNMMVDPLFIYPRDFTLAPTSEGNYHLQLDSPMRDKGAVIDAPADDIDGDVRPQQAGHDLGSDEVVF